MIARPLRFASFLAPDLLPVYRLVARHVGERLGLLTDLFVGDDYAQLADADVSFVCGLAYVELAGPGGLPLEAIAAPVLEGERYGGMPIYFSDVIVRRDSPFRCFADLRGRSWSYNEPRSHSGYGVTRHHLVRLGETNGYFGRVVEAGWHQRSIRLVATGEVDASAIDSQVLALAVRARPELSERLRIIDALGPSTIQPVVAGTWLSPALRADVQGVLLEMGEQTGLRAQMARGMIERFVKVEDGSYDDLRRMRAECAAAGLLTLR